MKFHFKFFLLFLFCGTQSLYAQLNSTSKEVVLNQNKWLIGTKKNYSNIDSLISIDQRLGFDLLVEKMEKIINENKGYQIPSSIQILTVLNLQYPSKKTFERIPCPKNFKCAKYYGMDFYEGGQVYQLLFLMLLAESFVSIDAPHCAHPHICNYCADWSEEYRKKEGCHKCIDEKLIYCGKTFICPFCKGKGFEIKEIEAKNNLSFKDYLTADLIYPPSEVFYFDSPTDFGIINLDTKERFSYSAKIVANNFNSLSFLLVEGSESVKQKIEEYHENRERNDQEKIKRIENIINTLSNNSLNTKSFSELVSLYDKLNHNKYKDLIKPLIQEKLNSCYTENPLSLSQAVYKEIITQNNTLFKDLYSGTYILKVDNKGSVFLSDSNLNIQIEPQYVIYGSFKVFVSAYVKLDIQEFSLNNGAKKALVSLDTRQVYQKSNGKYYKRNDEWTGADRYPVQVFNNKNVQKKRVRIIQPTIIKKSINNEFEILVGEKDIIVSEHKIRTQTGLIITTSLGVVSGISWLALRIWEMNLMEY
jgi:hypothetical protein